MSDASHRYERLVDAGATRAVSDRVAALIVEVAGGTVAEGVIVVGDVDTSPRRVTLRPRRCNDLLGIDVPADEQMRLLASLGLSPKLEDGVIACAVPSRRPDLEREVDLIEEVARLRGLDALPVHDKLELTVRSPQPAVAARRELARVLVAHGYHEAVTFSFVAPAAGKPFLRSGEQPVMIDDERRAREPMLRPSPLPSLLACRKSNQDAGNHGVKLFEVASSWARPAGGNGAAGAIAERVVLALLADAPDPANDLRALRGTITELVETLGGAEAASALTTEPVSHTAYRAAAAVKLHGGSIGVYGVLADSVTDAAGLQLGALAAELDAPALLKRYPPTHKVAALPRFPGIERDLSVVVDEPTPWAKIEDAARSAQPALLTGLSFLTTYRGKPIEKGRKSVSFRMTFRDPSRTLRHEQVDPQVAAVVDALKRAVGAELRA